MIEKKPASEDRPEPANDMDRAGDALANTKRREGNPDALTVRNGVALPLGSRRLAVPTRVLSGEASSAVATNSLPVVLWRSRWAVVLCLLVAAVAGVAYVRTVTPIYTSTAKLYLDYAGIRISNPYEPGGRPQTDKYLYTQAELIKSRPILASAWNVLQSRRLRTLAQAEVPTAYLQKNLTVEIGKKDEVISISLRSPHADEAAEIVNCVVDAYKASRSEHEQRNSAQVLRILQDELTSINKELDDRQKQLTAFRREHLPLTLGSDQGNVVTQHYLELQNTYMQAQLKTTNAERFRTTIGTLARDAGGLRLYVQLRGIGGPYLAADQEKAPLETKLIDLKHQREGLLETLTAHVPKVTALSAEIERIEARLKELDDQFVQAVTAAAGRQHADAKQEEEHIAELCRQQRGQVETLNADVEEYQRLRSKVEYLTTCSEDREKQVREISKIVGEDVGQLRMAVLEPAQPALVPSEPQMARIMAMALILGLLFGGGVAVARDWLDQTLRSTDEISALLRVPVLGAVPAMSRRKRMQERGRKVLLQPDSHEAEAFRTIRTAVLFSASASAAKTLLITSPAAGDGKSTLVSNLAIAMARAGQKTLILDADFRKPTQHLIFGLDPQKRCLSDVFAGALTLAAAVQATEVEGLDILTCGYRVANPAEVLHSRQFAHLLTCLAEVYDRIVIDAPPVIVVTDAQILGALCDATVLVLKADKSMRRVALHAIDALQSVGAHLLGVVVNEVHKRGTRYGYYYDRYRKYYGTRPQQGGTSPAKSNVPVVADPRVLPVRMTSEGV